MAPFMRPIIFIVGGLALLALFTDAVIKLLGGEFNLWPSARAISGLIFYLAAVRNSKA